ncbi:MAG: trypsin-like peptidase domain-containing protein [Syntrophomonadaceae bacterium]|nr:trypsin-like peptidase domain-containing protein [Syntrophomonadaceae bacterium]MDD4548532.1 trypsin-like peptidase domain-containing protein [Syntrophomonadaceae bacterium]
MNEKATRGALYFVLFFCLGISLFTLFDSLVAPSKPMVNDEQQMAIGSISDVAAQVSPSVVGITNLSRDGDMFNQRSVETTGSGVIIDKDGYIVTNNHVVKGAEKIIATLADGNEEIAKLIGTDPRTDLAVIKIKVDHHVTPAQFGDSEKLVVGQEVIAIGNPMGLRFARSVTAGIVSGLNRVLTTEEGFIFHLLQTDAAINPGNSGGALVNLDGQVVGINTVKIAAEGFEGMGFSIPSNQVQTVVADIKKHGQVLRPVMGITILGEITRDQASYYNMPIANGVAIDPLPGGPAAKAGMKKYDIITKIDNQAVQTGLELQQKIFSKKIGQSVKVQFIRLPRTENSKSTMNNIAIKLTK